MWPLGRLAWFWLALGLVLAAPAAKAADAGRVAPLAPLPLRSGAATLLALERLGHVASGPTGYSLRRAA